MCVGLIKPVWVEKLDLIFLTKDIRLNPTHQQKNAERLPHLAPPQHLVHFPFFLHYLCSKNKKLAFCSQAHAVFK